MPILLLGILVSGFLYLNTHTAHYFKLHRYNGQFLYLNAALSGAIIFILSFFIVYTTNIFFLIHFPETRGFLIDLLNTIGSKTLNQKYLTSTTLTSIFVATLGKLFYLFSAWVIYIKSGGFLDAVKSSFKRTKKMGDTIWIKKPYRYIVEVSNITKMTFKLDTMESIFNDSPLDSQLLYSFKSDEQIAIATKQGHVFIGNVLLMGEPTINKGIDQEIVLKTRAIALFDNIKEQEFMIKGLQIIDSFPDWLEIVIRQEDIYVVLIDSFEYEIKEFDHFLNFSLEDDNQLFEINEGLPEENDEFVDFIKNLNEELSEEI